MMTDAHMEALAEIARLRAQVTAYADVLDEIMATTTDSRARTMASGVLSDYMERANERGTV